MNKLLCLATILVVAAPFTAGFNCYTCQYGEATLDAWSIPDCKSKPGSEFSHPCNNNTAHCLGGDCNGPNLYFSCVLEYVLANEREHITRYCAMSNTEFTSECTEDSNVPRSYGKGSILNSRIDCFCDGSECNRSINLGLNVYILLLLPFIAVLKNLLNY